MLEFVSVVVAALVVAVVVRIVVATRLGSLVVGKSPSLDCVALGSEEGLVTDRSSRH